MAGKRHKDFRGGDLGEDLGIFLLKSVCSVAPVPRPEDVGVDVVATLLREDGDFLVAEDSFFVQLKSSQRTITYSAEEIAWIRQLKLPFYIAFVDRRRAKITLFAALDALCWILDGEDDRTTRLYFHKEPKGHDSFRVSLADKAVLSWSVEELQTEGCANSTYQGLKRDIERQQRNIRWRRYGIFEAMSSKGADNSGQSMRGSRCRIPIILEDMKEMLFALGFNCVFYDRRGAGPVLSMIEFAHHHGIEIDPIDKLGIMFRLIRPGEAQ